jgi:4-oxalocrotonate tautomerase
MPNITIEGPKLANVEAKRELVKEITDSVEKAYKIPRDHIIIAIKSLDPENVSVAGTLITDRRRAQK